MTDKLLSFAEKKRQKEIDQMVGKCGTEVPKGDINALRKRKEIEQRAKDNARVVASYGLLKRKGGPTTPSGGGTSGTPS